MITPLSFAAILRHFDAIDQAVSRGLLGARAKTEPSLTEDLTRLMSTEEQAERNLDYRIDQLNQDLLADSGPISLRLETREYSSHVENLVTQSDLGLIVNFNNSIKPSLSVKRGWLLQAKRLDPYSNRATGDPHVDKPTYTERSAFSSVDKDQQSRMQRLSRVLSSDALRYLYYCPRLEDVPSDVQSKLRYLRAHALFHHIFDHTPGLALRDELMRAGASLSAGLFVGTAMSRHATKFGHLYQRMFTDCLPLSWFIALQAFLLAFCEKFPKFVDTRYPLSVFGGPVLSHAREIGQEAIDVFDVIAGDQDAMAKVCEKLDVDRKAKTPFRVFPARTLTVGVALDSPLALDLD